jgi:hypothetical protein
VAVPEELESLDQREKRLSLFDDIGGELGRVAAAGVPHRVDRPGRYFATIEPPRYR